MPSPTSPSPPSSSVRAALAYVVLALAAVLAATARLTPASAHDIAATELAVLFPAHSGPFSLMPTEGTPAATRVYVKQEFIGYAFSTYTVTRSIGFGGKPLDIHLGLGLDGRITGARLAVHEEPILVIGVSPEALETFVHGLAGINIREGFTKRGSVRPGIDHVAGATTSSTIIKDVVLRSARAVAAAHGLLARDRQRSRLDISTFETRSWADLVADASVATRQIMASELRSAIPGIDARSPLITLYAALATVPTIGQNLLGKRTFEAMQARMPADDNMVLLAAKGLYSIKGTQWRQTGVFDRIAIAQGDKTFQLTADAHENVEQLALADAPELREIGVFRLPAASGFDATKPWRLQLIVEWQGAGSQIFELPYELPRRYISSPAKEAAPGPSSSAPRSASRASEPATAAPSAAPVPARPSSEVSANPPEPAPELWVEIWEDRKLEIAVTVAMLVFLAAILFSHDLLVRNVFAYRVARISFLVCTVLFLGLWARAQLSVVHVVTFVHAVLNGFKWDQFLLDPLAFVLWSFVALCLLFWGRGVFCGWLCPFGALQELLNELGRKFGVKQIEVPWSLHERLWPIKYVAFLAILGLSLRSATQAFTVAEIEPFKTVVALRFLRHWPFVAYAVLLLAAGLFIERFYCRYLCPLGAALAIPAKLRLFEWLKRRSQCGRECRVCATRCTVQAINPVGQIVPNECIYCLQCQANYYDNTTCLPLIQRARRKGPPAATTTPSSEIGPSA